MMASIMTSLSTMHVAVDHGLLHFPAVRLGRRLFQEERGGIIFGRCHQVGVEAENHQLQDGSQSNGSEYHHPGEEGGVKGIDDKGHKGQCHQVGKNNIADQEAGVLLPG